MAVYSEEEEAQFAPVMAGYGTIKYGDPSRLAPTLLCAEWGSLKQDTGPDDPVGY